ncbi:PREDICTED: serine/threonine-protein kinase pakG [Tarenaya hassleriana]|uniref:serine/threonine-protein kinase pakG n=1 Tax=Tarenaya hassleriana TaxID=28532 RepID=UPI00053C8452|nr:PREDICTED: serine/threonine-protein kinase pakG [Tarenaya hassleriana]
MDSGNSSSMQSSSGGGEDEYDSRADHSISTFFNHHSSAAARSAAPPGTLYHHRQDNIGGPIPDHYPPQQHLDPLLSNYFTNLDTTVWSSKTVRSGPDLAGSPSEPVFFSNSTSLPRPRPNSSSGSVPGGGDNNKNGNNNNNMARNPKKRSRASRRAPTTVLTTDTTNFRAMVQEFTGIPAPPFTGSSPFPRTGRFDLFGFSPNSSFPLKPFAQKLVPPLFLSSSSSPSTATIASSSSPSSSSYYLPSADNQNLLNTSTNTQGITNPFLNIHAPKDPLTDPSIFSAKSKPLFDQSSQNFKVGNVLDELGQFGTNFGGLQSIFSSSSTSTLMHINRNSDAGNVEADLLRSINGGFDESAHRPPSYRATGTATATAASSGSLPAAENSLAAARNEGMVESWICSSD